MVFSEGERVQIDRLVCVGPLGTDGGDGWWRSILSERKWIDKDDGVLVHDGFERSFWCNWRLGITA